jgi:acetyl-CoA carboxylase carboxyl transferase subunit alpha
VAEAVTSPAEEAEAVPREQETPSEAPTRIDDEALQEAVWARVQMARNVQRPHTLELMSAMATDVVELHGDRTFGDDPALVGGLATLGEHRVVFLGHQKGAEVDENIRRNFGMPHPEGYRKAGRLLKLAERLGLPVVTFVDTPGAAPDAPSEERGQAEAIARNIAVMTSLRTPVVTVITGEGGSGGALAIAVGDVVLALENAIYSVISPEGCASILWRTADKAKQAAVAMRLTAGEQQALGVIDTVISEPAGGAHEDPDETARRLAEAIEAQLDALVHQDLDALVTARYRRYRSYGAFTTKDLPVRERHERQNFVERLRALLSSGQPVLSVGEGQRLDPVAVDENGDEHDNGNEPTPESAEDTEATAATDVAPDDEPAEARGS